MSKRGSKLISLVNSGPNPQPDRKSRVIGLYLPESEIDNSTWVEQFITSPAMHNSNLHGLVIDLSGGNSLSSRITETSKPSISKEWEFLYTWAYAHFHSVPYRKLKERPLRKYVYLSQKVIKVNENIDFLPIPILYSSLGTRALDIALLDSFLKDTPYLINQISKSQPYHFVLVILSSWLWTDLRSIMKTLNHVLITVSLDNLDEMDDVWNLDLLVSELMLAGYPISINGIIPSIPYSSYDMTHSVISLSELIRFFGKKRKPSLVWPLVADDQPDIFINKSANEIDYDYMSTICYFSKLLNQPIHLHQKKTRRTGRDVLIKIRTGNMKKRYNNILSEGRKEEVRNVVNIFTIFRLKSLYNCKRIVSGWEIKPKSYVLDQEIISTS